MRDTHARVLATLLFFLCLSVPAASAALAAGAAEPEKDPVLVIPFCAKPPVIDGKLSPGEWDRAAAVSLIETCGPRLVRKEQAVFYVCWDKTYLYVAMTSDQSRFTDGLSAACASQNDSQMPMDDCVAIMLAPGTGNDLRRTDLPVFCMAVNSIGTLWDAKFFPLLNDQNAWESGMKRASTTDGTRWTCEMRIPWATLGGKAPQEGAAWRLNLVRDYADYDDRSGWSGRGLLNDASTGADVVFSARAPAVRLLGAGGLPSGKLNLPFEVANPTDEPQTVLLRLDAAGQENDKAPAASLAADERTITVPPGQTLSVDLGKGEALKPLNRLNLQARDAAGRTLFSLDRQVALPLPAFVKWSLHPLVDVTSRFLPSLERLAVSVNMEGWIRKAGAEPKAPAVSIKVFKKGEDAQPVLEGAITEFKDQTGSGYVTPEGGQAITRLKEHAGLWRGSTRALPDGEYVVKVAVTNGADVIETYDDWFEKRQFDWMIHPRGAGEDVPAPYTPLEARGVELRPWGRAYQFGRSGLPTQIVSQEKEILADAVDLLVEVDGKPVAVNVVEPFAFRDVKPGKVQGRSVLTAGDLQIQVDSTAEYDGFLLFRLTYGPKENAAARIGRMRVKVPIRTDRALFYCAAGDDRGSGGTPDLLPAGPGRIYDSLKDTRCVCCSPTFATLFWVADHDVCFCYAADNDKGWLIRDDAPAVEAYREGPQVTLWLNVVDKPWELTAPRAAEFALQAGPTKPLPEGWRGIQDAGHPTDAPVKLIQIGGSGDAMPGGGIEFIHPGVTPEQVERSRRHIAEFAAPDHLVVGYNFWLHVPAGFAETRVFRGEWGISKELFEIPVCSDGGQFAYLSRDRFWRDRYYGEDKRRYYNFWTNGAQSYLDFLTYAWDLALAGTPISGTYDDCGLPHPVYDEELGLGFVREDGRKVWSSGLWAFRERWKRAQYVQAKHGRFNALSDSQCVSGYYLLGENFMGCWRPCEWGYYNTFKDRDNFEFYGSLERYAAYSPSKQYGLVPAGIGLSSPHAGEQLARDTRGMVMLTFLHDQDLGCFGDGGRDSKVIGDLRRAKNLFRQWEKEVDFIGYWDSERYVTVGDKALRVSLYTRPDRAMFFVGNVGNGPVDSTLTPNWTALKLDPKRVAVTNAETGERIATDSAGDGIRIAVPRHDLRIVLIAPAP